MRSSKGLSPVVPESEIRVGELRLHTRLGSEAVYRVCVRDGNAVVLEVVRAPGLSAGQRFRYTADAVRRMAVVESDPPTGEGGGSPP